MAAEDVPRCPACRRKQTLTSVPESEQLLIENNACQCCRKLQKTFVDIPSSHRPQFNRSASCPAGSKVSVVTYLPEGENVIDFLTQEEDKEEDANDSMDDVKIDIDASEVLPRQPAGRISKQTIFNVIFCSVLVLILVVLLYILFVKHSPNDEEHTHHSPRPLNFNPPRNVTGVPNHGHHCISQSVFVVDSSKLGVSSSQQPNVPFTLVNSTDMGVNLTEDGRTVIFNNPGHYDIDVDFIMDTYSLDSFSDDRPYQQSVCLSITGRSQVCRPLIMHRWMRMSLRVNADLQAHPGQRLSVFVVNRRMLFPDPNGNILTIIKKFC